MLNYLVVAKKIPAIFFKCGVGEVCAVYRISVKLNPIEVSHPFLSYEIEKPHVSYC